MCVSKSLVTTNLSAAGGTGSGYDFFPEALTITPAKKNNEAVFSNGISSVHPSPLHPPPPPTPHPHPHPQQTATQPPPPPPTPPKPPPRPDPTHSASVYENMCPDKMPFLKL